MRVFLWMQFTQFLTIGFFMQPFSMQVYGQIVLKQKSSIKIQEIKHKCSFD